MILMPVAIRKWAEARSKSSLSQMSKQGSCYEKKSGSKVVSRNQFPILIGALINK